ncbi:MAG: DUF2298 domain-containing protein, partial [Acidimicrobiales bacterium]
PVAGAVALAAVAGVLVGAVRAVNTWDFPLACLLALAPPVAAVVTDRSRWRRTVASAGVAASVVVVGWAPYVARSEVTDTGLVVNDRHTPLTSWLAQFGLLAAATLLAVGTVLPPLLARLWRAPGGTRALAAAAVAATGAVLVAAPDATAFVMSALLAGLALLAAAGNRLLAVPCLLAAVGWVLVAAIEVVSVVNDTNRMNTVFKGWFQAWLLLGLAAAGIVAGVHAPRLVPVRVTSRLVLGVAVLMATAFVQLATPPRLDDRTSPGGLTLDGLAFFAGSDRLVDPDDRAGERPFVPGDDDPLIEWLQRNVDGIVTVAEAPGYDYTWRSRISVFTGLPTVIGWPHHETQQRRAYGAVIDDREQAMNRLYASADPEQIAAVLQRFDIRYVVFGTAEVVVAGERGRRALLEFPCLDVRYRHGDLFVAAVDQHCVAGQPGTLPVRS